MHRHVYTCNVDATYIVCVDHMQDTIADVRRKMAANTKESDEKTRAIREVS